MKRYTPFIGVLIGILALPQFVFAQFQATSIFPGTGTSFGGTAITGTASVLAGCGKNVMDVFSVFGGRGGSNSFGSGSAAQMTAVPTSDSKTQSELEENNKREKCLDTLAYQLAKQSLAQVTQETINWVNTGFEGDPFFVRDSGSFFKNIANQEIKTFTDGLLNDTSSPYASDVARTIISKTNPRLGSSLSQSSGINANATRLRSQYNQLVSGYEGLRKTSTETYKKMLSDASALRNNPAQYNQALTEAENYRKVNDAKIAELQNSAKEILNNDIFKIDSFQNDFASGGWDMWLKTTQLPQNNPVGAYWTTIEDLNRKVNNRVERYQSQLDQSGGFLNQERCVNPRDYKAGGDVSCLQWETVTPGSVIAEQVNLTLGTSQRQLELADSINESLAAVFNAVIGQLRTKGLSRIQTNLNSQFSIGGSGLNRVVDSYGNDITGQDLYNVNQSAGFIGSDFDIKTDIPKVILTQEEYRYEILGGATRPFAMCRYLTGESRRLCLIRRATTHTGSLSYLPQITPEVGKLDYVLPGPNPAFTDNLSEKVQAVVSYVEGAQLTLNGSTSIGTVTAKTTGSPSANVDIPVQLITGNAVMYPEASEDVVAITQLSKDRIGTGYYIWEDYRYVRLYRAAEILGVKPTTAQTVSMSILNVLGGLGSALFDIGKCAGASTMPTAFMRNGEVVISNGYGAGGLGWSCSRLHEEMQKDWEILNDNFNEIQQTEINNLNRVAQSYQNYIKTHYDPIRKPTSGSGYLRDSEIAYSEVAKLIYMEDSVKNTTASYESILENININIAYLLEIDREVKAILRVALARPENRAIRFSTACLIESEVTPNTRPDTLYPGAVGTGTNTGTGGVSGGVQTGTGTGTSTGTTGTSGTQTGGGSGTTQGL